MKEGRWFTFSLLSTFFIALTLRLILPLEFNVWGPDTGENYYIAKFFAVNGMMPSPYYGFGLTYTEFPTAYQLVASIARLAGVSTASSVELTTSFVTSFLVFPVAGIALTVTGRKSAGILAALFYATSTVIVGHTSILASDPIGEVVLVFFIYFYLNSRRDRMMTAMAMISGLAMIPTYHLGTVILLLFLYTVLFYYSFFKKEDGEQLLKSLTFILIITTLTWIYWLTEAPVFLVHFILENPHLTLEEAISAPYLLAFMLFILGSLFRGRRWAPASGGRLEIKPVYPIAAIVAGVAGVSYLSLAGVSSIPIYPSAYTLLDLPTVVCTLLGIAAFLPAVRSEAKTYPLALTLLALGVIVLVGVVTNIDYLVPERMVEYLLLFIATFSGIGIMLLIEMAPKNIRVAVTVVLTVALVVTCGVSTAMVGVTTTPSKIGATPAKDLSATQWLKWNTGSGSVVASDHRLSSLVFGFSDRNATWEIGGYPIFMAKGLSQMEGALNLSQTPSGNKTVDFLMLDTYMVQGANFYPNQTAIPIPPAVLVNISNSGDFVLVYSNGFSQLYAYAP